MAKSKPDKTSMKKTTKHVDDDADDDIVDDDAAPMVKSKKQTKNTVDDEDFAALDGDEEPPVDDDDTKQEDEKPSADHGPKTPSAKITKTALVLILLNWIMAPAFLYVAYMDNTARTQYAFRTLVNYIQVWGLPLRSEEDFSSIAMDTRPRLRMTPDQLHDAVKQRVRKSYQSQGVSQFVPFEETLDKPIPFRLKPSDMQIPELKREVFQTLSDPVDTLEDAIEKLQTSVPTAIKTAADEIVEKNKKAKDDDEKRGVIARILLPIAWDIWQIEKLDKKLEATKGKDLDAMLADAAQRRMYYDILAPLNIYKPGEIKNFAKYEIEKLSSLDDYTIDQVKEIFVDRLKAAIAETHDPKAHLGKDYTQEGVKRDSIEKRQTIAFILFTLSQVSAPTLDRKLLNKGVERAQVICGLHEFTDASLRYVRAERILEERMIAAVIADRQGYIATVKDKLVSTPGFIGQYEKEIDRLVEIAERIDRMEKQLAGRKTEYEEAQKIYVQRVDQHKKTLGLLLDARKTTAKAAGDLRVIQDQLHRALVELSDAAEVNFRLYEEIRDLELRLLKAGNKGGKN